MVKFGVAPVIIGAFTTFSARFGHYAALAILFSAPTAIASIALAGGGAAGLVLAIIINVVVTAIGFAVTVYSVMMDLRGQPASFSQCLKYGVERASAAISATFLIFAGALILCTPLVLSANQLQGGSSWLAALLLVPLLVFVVRSYYGIAINVVENLGGFESVKRSIVLTGKRIWSSTGVAILAPMVILSPIFAFSLWVISEGLSAEQLIARVGEGTLIGVAIVETLLKQVLAIAIAYGFFALRHDQEGVGP